MLMIMSPPSLSEMHPQKRSHIFQVPGDKNKKQQKSKLFLTLNLVTEKLTEITESLTKSK